MTRVRINALVVAAAGALCACSARGAVLLERRPYVATPDAAPPAAATLRDLFTREELMAADGTRLPYRLLAPAAAPPGTTPPGAGLPLVVVLHGSGAIGGDNVQQLGAFPLAWARTEIAAEFPAWIAVPQVAVRSADYVPGDDGLLESHPGASLPLVVALIEELSARPGVDRGRIYVVGFSMGASAALNLAVLRPDLVAGVVAFSGVAPRRALAVRTAATSQLLVHGTADDENPIGPDRAWVAALAAAGARPRLVEIVGMDHRVAPEMVGARDWRAWLFAQRLGTARDAAERR